MTCTKCNKEIYFDMLCKPCFQRQILKKIRKEIRINNLFNKNDTFIVIHPLCEYVLKDIVKDMPCYITNSNECGEEKEVILWTMNDEIASFLNAFFKNEILPEFGHTSKKIKLFLTITDKELEAFTKSLDISWNIPERGTIGVMIEDMCKKHPETQHAISKNIQKLKKILQEKEGNTYEETNK